MTDSTQKPAPFDWDAYEDFSSDEGDGELGDPALSGFEGAHDDIRDAWKDWHCRRGSGTYVAVKFYGKSLPVPEPAYDAYRALEQALKAAGYETPRQSGTYVCRHIKDTWEQRQKDAKGIDCGSTRAWSLHAYGVAIDIDEDHNRFEAGDRYNGWMKKHHVDSVLSIKNTAGEELWEWGGFWDTPDRMHFQINQSPRVAAVDWSTVPGAGSTQAPAPESKPVEAPELDGVTHRVATETSGLNVRSQPTTGGSIIATVPKGTAVAVQSGPPREADGYPWVKIKAAHRGQIIEGWVARDFLEPVATSAESTTPDASPRDTSSAAAEGATYRVATKSDDLRMRSQPTTEGDNIIVELPKGTLVTALSDAVQRSGDHEWLKVRASVDGETHDGWVAMGFLQPVG